jgi:hypothetical protein
MSPYIEHCYRPLARARRSPLCPRRRRALIQGRSAMCQTFSLDKFLVERRGRERESAGAGRKTNHISVKCHNHSSRPRR